jgi:hypothetical protein
MGVATQAGPRGLGAWRKSDRGIPVVTDTGTEVFGVDLRAHPLVRLDEQYADLLAALDRGEALRRSKSRMRSTTHLSPG